MNVDRLDPAVSLQAFEEADERKSWKAEQGLGPEQDEQEPQRVLQRRRHVEQVVDTDRQPHQHDDRHHSLASTASAELSTSPMRSRWPRPSASATNRTTPDCSPRSEILR